VVGTSDGSLPAASEPRGQDTSPGLALVVVSRWSAGGATQFSTSLFTPPRHPRTGAASAGTRGPVITGRAARWAGQAGPARVSQPGGRPRLSAQGRAWRVHVPGSLTIRGCPAIAAGLDAERRPRILARRVPQPERGSLFLKVSGGEAASLPVWARAAAPDASNRSWQPSTVLRTPAPDSGASWSEPTESPSVVCRQP